MEDSYNFDALLGQVNEKAIKAYELAAEHSINFTDLFPAMGAAIEAYIKTVCIIKKQYPDADNKRTVILSFAGILMGVKAHEAFGLKIDDMYAVTDAMYEHALFKIKYQFGNPEGVK